MGMEEKKIVVKFEESGTSFKEVMKDVETLQSAVNGLSQSYQTLHSRMSITGGAHPPVVTQPGQGVTPISQVGMGMQSGLPAIGQSGAGTALQAILQTKNSFQMLSSMSQESFGKMQQFLKTSVDAQIKEVARYDTEIKKLSASLKELTGVEKTQADQRLAEAIRGHGGAVEGARGAQGLLNSMDMQKQNMFSRIGNPIAGLFQNLAMGNIGGAVGSVFGGLGDLFGGRQKKWSNPSEGGLAEGGIQAASPTASLTAHTNVSGAATGSNRFPIRGVVAGAGIAMTVLPTAADAAVGAAAPTALRSSVLAGLGTGSAVALGVGATVAAGVAAAYYGNAAYQNFMGNREQLYAANLRAPMAEVFAPRAALRGVAAAMRSGDMGTILSVQALMNQDRALGYTDQIGEQTQRITQISGHETEAMSRRLMAQPGTMLYNAMLVGTRGTDDARSTYGKTAGAGAGAWSYPGAYQEAMAALGTRTPVSTVRNDTQLEQARNWAQARIEQAQQNELVKSQDPYLYGTLLPLYQGTLDTRMANQRLFGGRNKWSVGDNGKLIYNNATQDRLTRFQEKNSLDPSVLSAAMSETESVGGFGVANSIAEQVALAKTGHLYGAAQIGGMGGMYSTAGASKFLGAVSRFGGDVGAMNIMGLTAAQGLADGSPITSGMGYLGSLQAFGRGANAGEDMRIAKNASGGSAALGQLFQGKIDPFQQGVNTLNAINAAPTAGIYGQSYLATKMTPRLMADVLAGELPKQLSDRGITLEAAQAYAKSTLKSASYRFLEGGASGKQADFAKMLASSGGDIGAVRDSFLGGKKGKSRIAAQNDFARLYGEVLEDSGLAPDSQTAEAEARQIAGLGTKFQKKGGTLGNSVSEADKAVYDLQVTRTKDLNTWIGENIGSLRLMKETVDKGGKSYESAAASMEGLTYVVENLSNVIETLAEQQASDKGVSLRAGILQSSADSRMLRSAASRETNLKQKEALEDKADAIDLAAYRKATGQK